MLTPTTKAAVLAAATAVGATAIVMTAWPAGAAPGDIDGTYVPIAPCRLADTRDDPFRVGTTDTFTEDQTVTFAAHGVNGDCDLPADAVGLALNVTATGATAPTFVTVFPDGERPNASNLNQVPGQQATPNAVQVELTDTGSFDVYNRFGEVDIIIDVNGYYTSASLTEIDERLAALEERPALDSFLVGIDRGETAELASNGPISIVAGCVYDDVDDELDAVIYAATTEDDMVVMHSDADEFTGNSTPPYLLPATAAVDREMFVNLSVPVAETDVENYIDGAFILTASGEYLGLDGETLAIGVNYGGGECFFAGTTTSFTSPPAADDA